MVFIEVKASSGDRFGPPELRVDRKKQERIIAAAAEYLSRLKHEPEEIRFDVIAVTWRKNLKPSINHIESAFRVEEG